MSKWVEIEANANADWTVFLDYFSNYEGQHTNFTVIWVSFFSSSKNKKMCENEKKKYF
jgi:hypothetical protein